MTTTYVVHLPEFDQTPFYSPELEAEYRGMAFKREGQYQLYYIVPPEGKQLPSELASRFTALLHLQKAIDRWYLYNPSGGLRDIPPPPPVAEPLQRGRIVEILDQCNFAVISLSDR
jgi:hypothetical protein